MSLNTLNTQVATYNINASDAEKDIGGLGEMTTTKMPKKSYSMHSSSGHRATDYKFS